MPDQIKIYIYGSCHFSGSVSDNDIAGNGGYGIVININGKRENELSGGYAQTTNARMDIMAITEALKQIETPAVITVYLSNGYILDTLTKGWLQNWKLSGFHKKKHADLWKQLDNVLSPIASYVTFAHSRTVQHHPDFKLAEQLAKNISGKLNLPLDKNYKSEPALFDIFDDNDDKEELKDITDSKPILDSISVDASCIGNPGPTEYRGVDTKTAKLIFEHKYEEATNNIGEFLAIVHALALYKKEGKELQYIYSDSSIAISWIKQKTCKTRFEQTSNNSKLFSDIQRAINWLHQNTYTTKILKWNTAAWGQIPADYGRK